MGLLQQVVPGPALLRVLDAILVKDLFVVVDAQRRKVLGQHPLLALPLARLQDAGQVDARVQRIVAVDEVVQRKKGPLVDEHGHCIVADLHDVRGITGGDLGQQPRVVVPAGHRLELDQDVGVFLLEPGNDLLVRVQSFATVARADAQDHLGSPRMDPLRAREWR